MELYYADTLSPRKACAAARHLGSPVAFIRVDLAKGEHRRPEYLAMNPNGKVPLLMDGGRALWEADAIMCHLAVKAGSDLWPRDGEGQVDVIRWFSWAADHFNRAAGALYFEHIIKPRFGLGAPDAPAVEEATASFRRFARVLDDHLRAGGGRAYLLGDALTVADFAVAATLPYADEARIPLAEFAAVRGWHERLCELPAWREPFPRDAA